MLHHDLIFNWKTFCVRPKLVEEQLRLDVLLALLIKTRYVSYFSFFKSISVLIELCTVVASDHRAVFLHWLGYEIYQLQGFRILSQIHKGVAILNDNTQRGCR
jgi:hypothetical protein